MGEKAKQKYYVVWRGKETGVFNSWEKCKRQIDGFAGAQYRSFPTKEAAERAYTKSPNDFIGKVVAGNTFSSEQLAKIGKPLAESICVDAAYNGREMEYKGVYTKTKQELFKMGPFEDATNNIGEFLAIVHALSLLKKQKSLIPVYSDSITALHWVKLGHANTKLKHTPANKSLFYLIERAEKWLKENNPARPGGGFANKLLKWETKAWGENPADFGRK